MQHNRSFEREGDSLSESTISSREGYSEDDRIDQESARNSPRRRNVIEEFNRMFPPHPGTDERASMLLNLLAFSLEQFRVYGRVVSPELRQCRHAIYMRGEHMPLLDRFTLPTPRLHQPAEGEAIRAGPNAVRELERALFFLFKKDREAVLNLLNADQRIVGVQLANQSEPSQRFITHPVWLLKLASEKLRPRFYCPTRESGLPIHESLARIRDLLSPHELHCMPLNIVGMVDVLQELAGFDPTFSVGACWPRLRQVLVTLQAPTLERVEQRVKEHSARAGERMDTEERKTPNQQAQDEYKALTPPPHSTTTNPDQDPSVRDRLLSMPTDTLSLLIRYVSRLECLSEDDQALLCLPLLLSDMEQFAYSPAVERMIFQFGADGVAVLSQRGEQVLAPRFRQLCNKHSVLVEEELIIELTQRSWHRIRHRGWMYNRVLDLLSRHPEGLLGSQLNTLKEEASMISKHSYAHNQPGSIRHQRIATLVESRLKEARDNPVQGPLDREETLCIEALRLPTA